MDSAAFQLIAGLNAHWQTGEVGRNVRKHERKRRSFFPLAQRLDDDTFHLIIGPRQVGKTTTLGHLMEHMLQRVPRRQVVYLPMDHPQLRLPLDAIVADLAGRTDGRMYIFLDELQESDDWAVQLKTLHDRWVGRITVFASGSNALALTGRNAHGAGRWRYHWMLPLKFAEIVEGPWDAKRVFRDALREGDLQAAHAALDEAYHAMLAAHPDAPSRFLQYLVHGGYPAAQGPEAFAFLHDVVHQGLHQDLSGHLETRKPRSVLRLLGRLAEASGGKVNQQAHAKELDATRQSVAKWLEALEFAFMIRLLPAVNAQAKEDARKPDKCYIQDAGVRAYLTAQTSREAVERGRLGETVEGVVLDHLHRLQSGALGRRDGSLGYHPHPEVDIVADFGGEILALEVKFGGDTAGHLAGMMEDATRIVVTRERFELGDVTYLPAWFFCWLC